ncbi:MAG: thiolase family protein [Firmicutes bacterium]|nr:thiolase family protein [Bacillota bacterium]
MIAPTELWILAAGRLPQGRFGGALAGEGALNLGVTAVRELLKDPALPRPGRVFWGMARSHTQGMNPARTLALRAGLGVECLGTTLNMACASSLEAVALAAQALSLGHPAPILAGGSEAMSDTPHLAPGLRWGLRFGHGSLPDVMHQDGLLCPVTGLLMGETIDRLAAKRGVSRQEADAYALESHRRAARAEFRHEWLAHPRLDHDECLRIETSLAELAALEPVFDPMGQVTAGNASALSDGAAALLLARPEQTEGLRPLAKLKAWTEAGLEPMDMGEGPIHAVRKLLHETGLRLNDITLWELNEAFASQVLVCAKALPLPLDRLNVAGGGISLGHPIGASGARILVTLVHQLRQRGGGLGVATLGIGGGLGQAVLVEVA